MEKLIKSDRFYRRLSHLVGYVAFGLLFGLLFLRANIEIKDVDLWLHLAMGRFIAHNGYIPDVDVLSSTIAGWPWINHEWLFQTVAHWITKLWSFDGLIGMQVGIVVATTILLLLIGYDKDKQLFALALLLVVFPLYYQRFTIRPDLFSLFFFVFYFYILLLHLDKKRSLFALFLAQVLWSNIHGFFFFGPLIVFLFFIGEWLKRHVALPYEWNKVANLSDAEYQRLKQIFGLVILGCFFNPYGIKGALYPLQVLISLGGESKVFFQQIKELHPPLTWGSLFSLEPYRYYKIMIVVTALGFVYNRRKIDVGILILTVLVFLFSLTAIRNMVYFSFMGFIACTVNFLNFSHFGTKSFRGFDIKKQHITSIAVKIVIIFFLIDYTRGVSYNGYYDFENYVRKSEFGGVSQRNFPRQAADFLVAHKVKGNFFNDFNSGAYLLGRLHPRIKVFIDGRTEVYGPEFFNYYRKIWKGDSALFDEAVTKYNLTGAFLGYVYVSAPRELMRRLYEDPQWALVYFDYDAAIFLKRVPENAAIIAESTVDLSNWRPKTIDLVKLGTMQVTPYQNANRGFALLSFGLPEAAQKEAEEALKVSPNYFEAYKILAEVYLAKEDYQKAFEILRVAKNLNSSDAQIRYYLAFVYEKFGELRKAFDQADLVYTREPDNPKVILLLAKILAKNEQYAASLKLLKKHGFSPADVPEVQKVLEEHTDR